MELKNGIYAIIGDKSYSTINQKKEIYILDNLDKYADKNKIIEALKMVNLNEDYLLRKSNNLSTVEYNKLALVNDLVNKEKIIILDHFEKGLCYKEKEYFKRLFKKISKDYGIQILIKTNDFSFCVDLVDEYIITENERIIKRIKRKDIYKENAFEYFDKHLLYDFVIKSRKYNHLKEDYTYIKDVLKAIYRELK
jgi:ABC-type dipeptide/oligopeptide/nickel transport system ATPase subunit